MSGAASIVAALLAGLGLLAAVSAITLYLVQRQRGRKRSSQLRRLPQQWPLIPRPLANTAEREVWAWLRTVFPDHQVMLKIPVTRFTMPREHGAANDWFEVLSGAYCTYAICCKRGVVVGCIDLVGPRGLSRGNRQLKQTLLAQCGIGYWVVTRDMLPAAEALRADFLGTSPSDTVPPDTVPPEASRQVQLDEVRNQLHQALDRNRNERHQHAMAGVRDTGADELNAQGYQTPWPQDDSFLASLDSRRALLDSQRAPLAPERRDRTPRR